eukprot:gene9618-9695_t
MISVLIWTGQSERDVRLRDVSRTLAALVPFAVEGLVRDVNIVTDAPDAGLMHLADEAGANLFDPVAARLAIAALKSDLGLVLGAGFDLDNRLADQIERHVQMPAGMVPVRIEMQGLGWFKDRFYPDIAGFLALIQSA